MDDPRLLLPELERHLLKPEVRSDRNAVSALLADDFMEFGASGRVWSRAEILAELATEPLVHLDASNFHVAMLSPELALVTYRSSRVQPNQPPRQALRSSIWRLQGDHWRIVFHQGTQIPA